MKKKTVLIICLFVLGALLPNVPWHRSLEKTYDGVFLTLNSSRPPEPAQLTLSGERTYTLLGFRSFKGTATIDGKILPVEIASYNGASMTLYEITTSQFGGATHHPIGLIDITSLDKEVILCFYEQVGDRFLFDPDSSRLFVASETSPPQAAAEQYLEALE